MIFKEGEQELEIIGDVKSNKVSIHADDIDHLTRVLSSQNYSYPIDSFIRETVSNAWDAHTKAGTKDPVIVELGEESGRYYCRIQDFGTGMSEETFGRVYLKLGGSDKRDDPRMIGGYGIGKFAGLSYTNNIQINTIFGGEERKYLMVKDGLAIDLPMVYKQPTTEPNGTEVKLYLENGSDYKAFKEAINKLVFFGNVYVNDLTERANEREPFSTYKVKRYKNFVVHNLYPDTRVSLLVGRVKYPLRDNIAKHNTAYPISLTFEVGEIEVLPNREEISYSTKTINKINEKLKAAIDEIEVIAKATFDKDCTDYLEYVQILRENRYLYLIEEGSAINFMHLTPTFKGVSYPSKEVETLHSSLRLELTIRTNCEVDGNKVKKQSQEQYLLDDYLSMSTLFFADSSTFSASTKEYIRDNKEGYYSNWGALEIKNRIRNTIFNYKRVCLSDIRSMRSWGTPRKFYKPLIKGAIEEYVKRGSKISSFSNEDVPLSFIKARKERLKLNKTISTTNWKENVKMTYVENTNYKPTFIDEVRTLKEVKDQKFLTIYMPRNEDRSKSLQNLIKNNNVRIALIAPTKIKLIKDFNNCMSMEEFLKGETKMFQRIGTVEYIRRHFPHVLELNNIRNLGDISTSLRRNVTIIKNYCDAHCARRGGEATLIKELYTICEKLNAFDEPIMAILKSEEKVFKNATVLHAFVEKEKWSVGENIPDKYMNIAVDYVLARKLFIPDKAAIDRRNKETIFNVKQEENEDTEVK